MRQTRFNLRLNVDEVHRLDSHQVQVYASNGPDRVAFKMYTSERLGPGGHNDTPKVNDDLLVTITTPAPDVLGDVG